MSSEKLPPRLFETSDTDSTQFVAKWQVYCPKCHYDLKRIPILDSHIQCPECGHLSPVGINEYFDDLEGNTPFELSDWLKNYKWWIVFFVGSCLISYLFLADWL